MRTLLCFALQILAALVAGAAPGTSTLSNLTMSPGGRYEFELNSATATPGSGADFLNITGVLDVAGGSTPNSVFTIAVISLNAANANAPLSNFDPTRAYHYTIATAAGGITGFNATEFAVDTSDFQNGLQGGHFSVLQSGNSLVLRFRPVALLPFIITNFVLDRASQPGAVRATLTWNAIIGLTYRIQKRADLTTGTWIDDSSDILALTVSPSATTFYTIPGPEQLFWRVIEVP